MYVYSWEMIYIKKFYYRLKVSINNSTFYKIYKFVTEIKKLHITNFYVRKVNKINKINNKICEYKQRSRNIKLVRFNFGLQKIS